MRSLHGSHHPWINILKHLSWLVDSPYSLYFITATNVTGRGLRCYLPKRSIMFIYLWGSSVLCTVLRWPRFDNTGTLAQCHADFGIDTKIIPLLGLADIQVAIYGYGKISLRICSGSMEPMDKKKDITAIENVQRHATKMLPWMQFLNYEDRLRNPDLITPETLTLKLRRARGEMIELYTIWFMWHRWWPGSSTCPTNGRRNNTRP